MAWILRQTARKQKKKKKKKKEKHITPLQGSLFHMSGNTCSNEYGEKYCQICQVDFALKNLIKKIVKIVKSINIHLVSWNFVKSAIIFIVAYISEHK